MEALLEESLQSVDGSYAIANFAFMNKFTEFYEETDGMDERLFTEKHQATVGEALRIFIASIINTIQKIKDTIQTQIEQKIFSEEYKKKVAELKNDVLNAQNSGTKTVEMVDFKRVTALYVQMVDTLCKKAEKISNLSYLTANGLDHDIKEFNDTADQYDHAIEKALETKKMVKIAEALDFVEKESGGNGDLLFSLDKAMREFKKMESNVKQIEAKEAIIGRDLILKKVVIIRRSSNRLVKSIRKWVARIVARCVFYFA